MLADAPCTTYHPYGFIIMGRYTSCSGVVTGLTVVLVVAPLFRMLGSPAATYTPAVLLTAPVWVVVTTRVMVAAAPYWPDSPGYTSHNHWPGHNSPAMA